jgi:hypothetical protein
MQWVLWQGRGLSSSLIGWFGGGGYSHVDVITPVGGYRGSRSDVYKSIPAGYEDRPAYYNDGNWLKKTIFDLKTSPIQDLKYWEFSTAQLHKPYDKRGILGFATGQRDWHDPKEWFCSEEVCANAEYAGIFPPMFEEASRVDPGDIAFILCALGASWKTETEN